IARYTEALDSCVEVGMKREEVYCVAGIAAALGELGRARRAAQFWGWAEAEEAELGLRMLTTELQRYERHIAAARAALGDVHFAAAQAEGAALPRNTVIKRALAAQASESIGIA